MSQIEVILIQNGNPVVATVYGDIQNHTQVFTKAFAPQESSEHSCEFCGIIHSDPRCRSCGAPRLRK